MLGKLCLLLSFIFCSFQGAKAQTSIKYTEENGLPTNHIYQVEQDAEGFIWFATNSGVVKFDGNKFKTFTTQEGLPTNDIWRIEATRDGKIWFFAKSKNLGYIQNDRVFSFPIDGGVAVQPRNFVINESEIFFTGNQNNRYGTFKLTDGRWKFMYSIGSDYFYELFLGKAILLHDGKKIRINNAENWLYDQNNNPLYQFKDVNPADLALINSSELPSKKNHFRERGIYCVLNFDGIIVYNFKDSTVYANKLFKDKETNSGKFTVPELQEFGDKFQISNGNDWILLDQKLNILERKQFDNNIPPVHIFKDSFGNFWTVNHETGVKVENTLHQSLKTYFDGRKVQTIAVQNGMVFLNVLNEGWYFRSAGMNDFKFLIPTYSRAYDMGFHDKFKLYYFLSGSYLNFGKNLFDLNAIERLYGRGLFYQYVGAKCILPIPTGFIGVNGDCVFKLDEKFDLQNADYRPDDSRFIRGINAISQFGNRIFLGGDGLYELINDSVAVIKHKHPIVKAPIKTMFVHDNLLFIGTDGFGAYTYDSLNNVRFIKGTEGLSVNKIVLYKNLIWMATWKGLRYFETNQIGGEYVLKGSVFDEDGLLSNRVNSMAVLDEELYLAFDNGLSVFTYSPELYKRPFKTYLADASNYNIETNTISAPYGDPVSISFGVLAFPSQKYVKYYYKTNHICPRRFKLE